MDPPPPSGSSISASNGPTWPTRTANACSNCRRTKVRCDGERPCSGCAKKNMQCLSGCYACRRARAWCEKTGDRCTRCEAEKIECTEKAPPTVPFVPTPPSTYRAKAACKNCKDDNKKCDDQRPCSRCVARSETCVAFGRAPKLLALRCEACKKENVRCDEGRPCQNCIAAGSECINIARQMRGRGPRVKGACISCRRNKIRCDGDRPCESCTRRGTDCLEQPCKRCAQDGSETCTHRSRFDQDAEMSETQLPSHADPAQQPSPLPSASTVPNLGYPAYYRMPVSDPSMFTPVHAPGQQPAEQNSLPIASSSTDSSRD